MLTLRVVHAHEGDCLVLMHGPNLDRYWLVDGGPKDTFTPHLSKVLGGLKPAKLEAVCLSHVDTDHTTGLQELFAELRDQEADGDPPLVTAADFWINQFGVVMDPPSNKPGAVSREVRLAKIMQAVSPAGAMNLATAALSGIKHGAGLVVLAKQLKIDVNQQTGGAPWIAGTVPPFKKGDLTVTCVGPTQANLDALQAKWDEWLTAQEIRIAAGKLELAAKMDGSIPNLSSIQLLVETKKKKLLLTGDGRGDHLLEALEAGGHLDDQGNFHVNVLKLPHHGSDRNVNREVFERLTADTYVASANGKDGNPDKQTLEWILEAAEAQGRSFELVLTNLPPAAEKFVAQNPPDKNNYTLRVRKAAENFIDVPIAQ